MCALGLQTRRLRKLCEPCHGADGPSRALSMVYPANWARGVVSVESSRFGSALPRQLSIVLTYRVAAEGLWSILASVKEKMGGGGGECCIEGLR